MMMKFSKLIRAAEWWEYKLPPLLAIGYATILTFDGSVYNYRKWLLAILLSLVAGAAYVSIINDVTDIKDDTAAGKANRMTHLPAYYRWLLPAACLLLGVFFQFTIYYPDRTSMILYSIPWVLFTIYSCPPFRFKNRRILGALCDAGGSHIFTSLLMVSSTSFALHQAVNPVWLGIVGVWSLCYGLRGILWHQYMDRKNDLLTGTKTVATKIPPARFRPWETVIFSTELIATLALFIYLNNLYIILAYCLYVLLCFVRYYLLGRTPVVILTGNNSSMQILQIDYFQCIFPLTLLLYASFTDSDTIWLLLLQVLLFPLTLLQILKDIKAAVLRLLNR